MSRPWSEMTPRERNALVAEKVMGWTHITIDADGAAGGCVPGVDSPDYRIPVPSYTTDISAAWEVVEKMRCKGVHLDISTFDDFFAVTPHDASGHPTHLSTRLASAPEAICLAALRASGVDV